MKLTTALFLSLCALGMSLVNPSSSEAATHQTSLPAIAAHPTVSPQRIAQANSKSAVLALDGEGLRIVNSKTGSTRSIAFGTKEADVLTILTTMQGKARDRGTNQECGAGPLGYAKWNNGLTVLFNQGRFAGWSVDGRSRNANKLTTIAGIGTGATRSQLNKAYTTKVFASTLGTEFSAGDLGGLLSGNKPSDRITTFWSGTTCLFR